MNAQELAAWRLRWLYRLFVVAALVSSVAALGFAYESGCAGDLKAGTWGDIPRALQFDNDFGLAWMLMLPLSALAVMVRGKGGSSAWIGAGVVFAALCVTYCLSWQFETWGNLACFPH